MADESVEGASDHDIESILLSLGRRGETADEVANRLLESLEENNGGGGGGVTPLQESYLREYQRRNNRSQSAVNEIPVVKKKQHRSVEERMKETKSLFSQPLGAHGETATGHNTTPDDNEDADWLAPSGLDEVTARFALLCLNGYRENHDDYEHDIDKWSKHKQRSKANYKKKKTGSTSARSPPSSQGSPVQTRNKRRAYIKTKPFVVADSHEEVQDTWNGTVLGPNQVDFQLPVKVELEMRSRTMTAQGRLNDTEASRITLLASVSNFVQLFTVFVEGTATELLRMFPAVLRRVPTVTFSSDMSTLDIRHQVSSLLSRPSSENDDTTVGRKTFSIAFPKLEKNNESSFINGIEKGNDTHFSLLDAVLVTKESPLTLVLTDEAKTDGIKLDSLKQKLTVYVALKKIPRRGGNGGGELTRTGQESVTQLRALAIRWRENMYPPDSKPTFLNLAYLANEAAESGS